MLENIKVVQSNFADTEGDDSISLLKLRCFGMLDAKSCSRALVLYIDR
jgi:hypothetical protein